MINSKLVKGIVLAFFAVPSLTYAQSVGSDTTNIAEIVISENRLQIPFNKTARNIQIITRDEIKKLSVKSINEVLAFVGGVDIRQRGPFGAQADIGIDGGSFEQTLILLNGVKISDPQTGHHSMNIPVSLDAVERIEVLKGPAARMYGINAFTGAVNIITKPFDASSLSVHVQAGSSFENKEAGDGSGIYGGGQVQVVANLGTQQFQNLLTISQDLYSGHRYNTAAKNRRAFYQGNLVINNDHSLAVMLGNSLHDFGANGFYAAPGDKESKEIVQTTIATLGSTHKFGSRWELKPRVSYRYNEDDYRYFKHDLSRARSEHSTRVLSAEVNSTLQSDIGVFGFGLETRSEKLESTNMGAHQRSNHGLYAEYKTELKRVLLNAGAYVNYNTQYGWQVFPGIDMAYLFDPQWKIAFNIGSSQRIPSFTDLYLKQAGNIGNASLVSENAWQYEGAVHYKRDNLKMQAGYFYRHISDFIDWVRVLPTDPYQSQNFGTNKIHGLNMSIGQEFNWDTQQSFRYTFGYNYLKPNDVVYTDDITSKYVLESLRHQGIARLSYTMQNWSVSSNNRWIHRELNKGYFIADMRFSYARGKFQVYADVTNIFDQSYLETAAVPMPGRWFATGVLYTIGK